MTNDVKPQVTFVDEKMATKETAELIANVFEKDKEVTELHLGLVAQHNNGNSSVAAMSFYGSGNDGVLAHVAHGPKEDLTSKDTNPLHELANQISGAAQVFETVFNTK